MGSLEGSLNDWIKYDYIFFEDIMYTIGFATLLVLIIGGIIAYLLNNMWL